MSNKIKKEKKEKEDNTDKDSIKKEEELEKKKKKEIYDKLKKWADSIGLPTVGSNDIDISDNIDES